MVSLSRSFNTNSGGATFFSESVTTEEREHLQPVLDSYGVFRPLKTIPAVSLHLIFTFALDVVSIVYAVQHPDEKSRCREYFVIMYMHIGLWFFTLVLDQVIKYKHHSLCLNGYLEFHQKMNLHISLPLHVVSLWSIVLMFVESLMQHFYPDDFAEKCVKGGTFSPIAYISALISLEFCVLAGINVSYMMRVWKFNSQKPLPDVQKEEWQNCTSPEGVMQSTVGYREIGDKVLDLLEKQAKLINFLQEHNARLGEKTMVLSAQLQQARNRGL